MKTFYTTDTYTRLLIEIHFFLQIAKKRTYMYFSRIVQQIKDGKIKVKYIISKLFVLIMIFMDQMP